MKNKGQAKKGTMKRLIQDAVRVLSGTSAVSFGLHRTECTDQLDSRYFPAEYHRSGRAVLADEGLGGGSADGDQTGPHPGCTVCAVSGSRLCVFLWNGDYHTGSLKKMREKMFNRMQDLPIKYFDTHNHGDIMSYYTNDIDTLRQLISQSIPQLLISCITVGYDFFNHAVLQHVAAFGRALWRCIDVCRYQKGRQQLGTFFS